MNKIWILPIVSILLIGGMWGSGLLLQDEAEPEMIMMAPEPQVMESMARPMRMMAAQPDSTTSEEEAVPEEMPAAGAPGEPAWVLALDMILKYVKELSTAVIGLINAIVLLKSLRKKD